AMRSWKVPAENIVYADVDGNIGWIPAGLLPVRRGWKGLFPVPGFTGEYEWRGFRDVDELPQRFNPPEGFIATANHNIRPPDYPYDLGFDWAPPYRYERIREVLSRGGKFAVADFERLQHDELSLPARRLVRLVETAPVAGDTVFRRARDLLAQWDRVLGKDSAAAALYEVWQPLLADHLVAAEAPGFDPELILENLAMPVLIELLTESPDRDEILRNSLREAWQETVRLLGPDPAAWRWGDLHKAVFRHPLANTDPRRTVFNLAPVERGGDGFTVNATRGPGFRQTHGASYRHVLDLADWDRSVFTTTPGQSGQPGSPHYADLLEPWAEGRYAPLLFTREAVENHTAHRLVLRPSAEPVGARAEGAQSKR
ncbi:MAG TPA: penicillin acylase family protein, partial [Thermopetrobacter sp.]|nr:penicillin acylase family protein [Thermopetrobacter sp.]